MATIRTRYPVAQEFPLGIIGRSITIRFFGKSGRTRKMNTCIPFLTLLAMCNWGLQVTGAELQRSIGKASPDREVIRATRDAERPAVPRPDPQTLLRQAISALEGHRSITADIRQSIHLFDQELFGAGYYMEQRTGGKLQFRLELRIQADADQEPSSLLKVFDGRYLWTYRNLGDSESLGRIDAEHVRQGLEESGKITQLAELGRWPGLGGLPRLLRGLNLAFDFSTIEAEAVRLKNRMHGWKIVGLWKPEQLVKMAPDLKESIEAGNTVNADDLPKHVPNSVVIVLGQQDLFPYVVEFRRVRQGNRAAENADHEGITLELLQVKLDGPTKPAWFIYNPGNLNYTDQTRGFLRSLGAD